MDNQYNSYPEHQNPIPDGQNGFTGSQNEPAQTQTDGAYRYSGGDLGRSREEVAAAQPAQPVNDAAPSSGVENPGGYTPTVNGTTQSGYGAPAPERLPYSGQSGYQPNPSAQSARSQNGDAGYRAQPGNPYGAQPGSAYGAQTGNAYGGQAGYNPADGNAYRAEPMSGYNVKPVQTKKKSSGGKKVVAAAIICALLGGIGGGAAVGMALRGGSAAEPESAAESVLESFSTQEQAAIESSTLEIGSDGNGNINTTVIDVKTNSETTEMTPRNVYEEYVNAVVYVANEGTANYWGQAVQTASSGSGFIISEDGYIVTNNHVVEGAEKLSVTMTNGETYDAELIGADSENDVALIKIDADNLPTVAIGDSDSIEVGDQVCAIGNPLGELTNTLTVGYISALDREITENGTPINMFQTDCTINSGNSGGPIFDMHGNVVGITTAKYSNNGMSSQASIEGIGFCVPINDAMNIVSDLLEYGYVKGRPSLGITCTVTSSSVMEYYHLPEGITVVSVLEGSAADKAGLQQGDIITELDGEAVASITGFQAKLKEYSAGDTVTLTIYRSQTAKTMKVDVVLDEKATDVTEQQTIPSAG